MIDLRSDTVSKPTPAMRERMAAAPVGDDGWRDDPTVLALEEMAAARLGKQAALFLPSGTMANLVAVLAQLGRGEWAVAESNSHVFRHELGGLGALAVPCLGLGGMRGAIDLDELEDAVAAHTTHRGLRTALLCLENTHTHCNGAVVPPAHMAAAAAIARTAGMAVHLDGARLFNAAVALRTTVADLSSVADTVCVCLCKGLGAPAGAVLAGPPETIDRATAFRRQLGGAMRQIGSLAAAGIVALETMADRLAEDHARARRLADAIGAAAPEMLDPAEVETNLVTLSTRPSGKPAAEWQAALAASGIRAATWGKWRLRMTLHHEIDDGDVARVAEAVLQLRGRCPKAAE
ncbi:MAG: GntG family PLP-dependent aldolase [Acetobacterales bacterium]